MTLPESAIRQAFVTHIEQLQDRICHALEQLDGQARFTEDLWERPEGGGGRTRVMVDGPVMEKAGVNISAVHGDLPEAMQQMLGLGPVQFFACGLSLVLHPRSPKVPTAHANWRYFECFNDKGELVDQWFGGGQDLTPYYLEPDDARHFHQVCKTVCDAHHPDFYPRYKAQCDRYFWNAHRGEARGVGGLFFDYCRAQPDFSLDQWLAFVTASGDAFIPAYLPIAERRKAESYTEAERRWQEIRRGRYVEFNLIHDKGTLFGLKTNGRIESILMSLPPRVQWVYNEQPEAGTPEADLLAVLRQPQDWV